jgi:RimJ/RimL family protein N-acetyltransferase
LTATGAATRLRPVDDRDAELIVSLRTEPERARHLHAGARNVAEQLAWLADYDARAGDYYFVVERLRDARPEGLVSLYGVDGRQAEFGRWILRPGSLAAPSSALLLYEIAFETLGLERVYARTVVANAAVVALHDRYGARRTGHPVWFDLAAGREAAVEHEVTRAMWPEVRKCLDAFAERAARLIDR